MTQVKICGLTRLEDAQAAVDAGADYLGFIFYEPSPRYISPKQVSEILASLQGREHIKAVGVCVNASLDGVNNWMQLSGVDYVQLHGQEPLAMIDALGYDRVIRVLRPRTPQDIVAWSQLPYLMIDGDAGDAYGGVGVRADWAIAADCKNRYNGTLFLAGGLTAHNVALAIQTVRPDVVDVSSGIEDSPGIKNGDQLKAFIAASKRS